jgi:NAD(P)-dependent dehydrogenase (short-subunit alcohol dehydrogenase family)
VEDHAQIEGLARALGGEAIDVLLCNAGVYGDREGFGAVDYEAWARTLRVNVMAPMKLAEAFVEQVARSQRKLIVNVTSLMGSIADNGSGGSYAYRSSKAALNAVTKSLSIDLASRGISACVIHPGWVRTDMGGPGAPLGAEESVGSMRRVIERAHEGGSGKFFDYDGEELPW